MRDHVQDSVSYRQRHHGERLFALLLLPLLVAMGQQDTLRATPANKSALEKHLGPLLVDTMQNCAVCHTHDHGTGLESLEEFPHNAFGERIRSAKDELKKAGKPTKIADRLALVAGEDSDRDGISNLDELLLGHQPGKKSDVPAPDEIKTLAAQHTRYADFQKRYPWEPFQPVIRPPVPTGDFDAWVKNPIDAFIAFQHRRHGLSPRPETDRATWLRRVTIDLTGLTPTLDELTAFTSDTTPDEAAREKVVDRLLASPAYGERWGRHWMDVWRYSDWAGYKAALRRSQRHIWRWRDWIVESLNSDKGYDQMLIEMLAADEIYPEDEDRLRATGYLARSYDIGDRNQWLDDVVSHSSMGFLGITVGCAKCHDHMYDEIAQEDYYRMRAIFEPYWVRTDRVPGELDVLADGLPRVYDKNLTNRTLFFDRGDERFPDREKQIEPGLPASVGGERYQFQKVSLPLLAHKPERRPFVKKEMMGAETDALSKAQTALKKLQGDKNALPEAIAAAELKLAASQLSRQALESVLAVEVLEDQGQAGTDEWKAKAIATAELQRRTALAEAKAEIAKAEADRSKANNDLKDAEADKNAKAKTAAIARQKAADKAMAAGKTKLKAAEKLMAAKLTEKYTPRDPGAYPATSTGRRSGFARWLTDGKNPLTARVAMNHIWLRHFGSAIVPTVNEFGGNGQPPTHPALLDWLAAELVERDWSMKEMHKLIVLSATYRQSSTPDKSNAVIDPDNHYLWRMNSRRMEGEIVRDNLLWVGGHLDPEMGGPDIPNDEALTSRRRSIYLRHAHEKLVEFVQIFDGPKTSECYQREESVQPHQALALANSPLTHNAAESLAKTLPAGRKTFVAAAWQTIVGRRPGLKEENLSTHFLDSDQERGRERLITVLLNHHEFVTIR